MARVLGSEGESVNEIERDQAEPADLGYLTKKSTGGPQAQEIRQEWQVRAATVRLLAKHLRDTSDGQKNRSAWGVLNVDLTDAALPNIDFSDATIGSASFEGAHFFGDAFFNRTDFSGDASFMGARFVECAEADFIFTNFRGEANFLSGYFRKAGGIQQSDILRVGLVRWCRI